MQTIYCTVLLSFLIYPLLFSPVYFGSRSLFILPSTHRPLLCHANNCKPPPCARLTGTSTNERCLDLQWGHIARAGNHLGVSPWWLGCMGATVGGATGSSSAVSWQMQQLNKNYFYIHFTYLNYLFSFFWYYCLGCSPERLRCMEIAVGKALSLLGAISWQMQQSTKSNNQLF